MSGSKRMLTSSGSGVPSADRVLPGVGVAAITAFISGVSVFVNSEGVHAIASPAAYTTAKNVVAALLLGSGALLASRVGHRRPASALGRYMQVAGPGGARTPSERWLVSRPAAWVGLAYVGIVGGGIAFVLFFDGLSDTTATPAAFWHDTLVVWVALLALRSLREGLAWWNVAAIGLLVVGQAVIAGGIGHLVADRGEMLVLAATVLWAIEVVVAKVLLREVPPAMVATTRMGVGALALISYLAATGALHFLALLDARQIGWVLLTGGLLAAYVATWMTALARARAVDVTSILVASAPITALLQAAAGTTSLAPKLLGIVLVLAGAGGVLWMARVSGARRHGVSRA
jgi:drug/metabolite transporter (DMT)-like permease